MSVRFIFNAAELALQRFLHVLGLFGIGIAAVGVEFLQHAHNGILNEFVLVDRVDIERVDGILGMEQLVQVLWYALCLHSHDACHHSE